MSTREFSRGRGSAFALAAAVALAAAARVAEAQAPTISVASTCGPEGTNYARTLDFALWLTAPSPGMNVYFHTQSGTAIGCVSPATGCDYLTKPTGSSVFVPAGTTSVFISIDIVNDAVSENPGGPGETFDVVLEASPTGAYVIASGGGTATGTVADDDLGSALPPRADFDGDGTTDLGWLSADLSLPSGGLAVSGVLENTRINPVPDYHDVPTQPTEPENPTSAIYPESYTGEPPPEPNEVHADLVLQEKKSGPSFGTTYLWARNPLASLSCSLLEPDDHWRVCTVPTPTSPASGWRLASVADFGLAANSQGQLPAQGGATPDIVWQSKTNGTDVKIGFLSNDHPVAYRALTTSWNTDGSFNLVGSGDFNGDHVPDLVWHKVLANGSSEVKFSLTLCATSAYGGVTSCTSNTLVSSPVFSPTWNWVLSGVYDVDSDGQIDLVWNNISSNRVVAWYMSYDAATNSITRRCSGYFQGGTTPAPSEGKKIVLPR